MSLVIKVTNIVLHIMSMVIGFIKIFLILYALYVDLLVSFFPDRFIVCMTLICIESVLFLSTIGSLYGILSKLTGLVYLHLGILVLYISICIVGALELKSNVEIYTYGNTIVSNKFIQLFENYISNCMYQENCPGQVDDLQHHWSCCGLTGTGYYESFALDDKDIWLPKSCCHTLSKTLCKKEETHELGCLYAALNKLSDVCTVLIKTTIWQAMFYWILLIFLILFMWCDNDFCTIIY